MHVGTPSTASCKQCSRRREPADHNCSPHTHDQICNSQWFLHAAPDGAFFVAAGVSRRTNLPPFGGSYMDGGTPPTSPCKPCSRRREPAELASASRICFICLLTKAATKFVAAIVRWRMNCTYLYRLRLHSFHKFASISVHSWFPSFFLNRELRE